MTFHRGKFKVVPLYREFLKFLEKKDFGMIEKNYLRRYEEYFRRFCSRWGIFGRKEIMERVRKSRVSHYSNVFEFDLRVYPNIDGLLKEIDKNLLTDLSCKIILYIGFFCPYGKTAIHNGEIIIGISLDRINDMRNFPLILAHEVGHAQRRKFFPSAGDSFEEIFFSEGIAFYFSHRVFPEIKVYRNLFIKRGEYSHIMKNIKDILDNLDRENMKREILNFLSFNYVKLLVQELNYEFKNLIQKEAMPLSFENFLPLFKKNIVS